jgi:hypothetical protein
MSVETAGEFRRRTRWLVMLGLLAMATDERVFGLSVRLEPGSTRSISEHIHQDDIGRVRDALLALTATMMPLAAEWRVRLPVPPERWVVLRSMPQRLLQQAHPSAHPGGSPLAAPW